MRGPPGAVFHHRRRDATTSGGRQSRYSVPPNPFGMSSADREVRPEFSQVHGANLPFLPKHARGRWGTLNPLHNVVWQRAYRAVGPISATTYHDQTGFGGRQILAEREVEKNRVGK